MELCFLIDTQLPPSLAEFFRRRGFNATHTTDYPSGSFMPDGEIIAIAINEKRIVITKDIDFFDYFLLRGYPPAILLLQLGNMKNSDLFQFLKKHLEIINELFEEEHKRMILVNSHQITVY
jgi:predicted nuclease of predicted toxin-antitoxin system